MRLAYIKDCLEPSTWLALCIMSDIENADYGGSCLKMVRRRSLLAIKGYVRT